MKFTTEQYNLICQTRDEIRALNNRQHTLYNNLLKELNEIRALNEKQHTLYNNLLKELNISIYAEDWMFDYIYNESGSIDDIEARM